MAKQGLRERLASVYKREWQNDRAREANLMLLKAVAFFTGAVIVSRNFGEAFAI